MAIKTTEALKWDCLESPLLKVVIPAFSDTLGDEPGKLPFATFLSTMSEAFPTMTQEQLAASVRLSVWGARNVIVMRLAELSSNEVSSMTSELAVLAADDDTSWAAAEYIGRVYRTKDRVEARPMLELLSQMAVENGVDYSNL